LTVKVAVARGKRIPAGPDQRMGHHRQIASTLAHRGRRYLHRQLLRWHNVLANPSSGRRQRAIARARVNQIVRELRTLQPVVPMKTKALMRAYGVHAKG
jgi:hypothetical protein